MERSRSKRHYYSYYGDDYESETLPRTRQRYRSHSRSHSHSHSHTSHHYYSKSNHRLSGGRKPFDPSIMVTTSFKILCHDARAGGVIGKSGSIIKAIRQHTGARINVHDLIPGDHEHIIEISDTRRRDPEGRMPAFSPSQEALLLIHERILECDGGNSGRGYNESGSEDDEEYESGRVGNHYTNCANNSSSRVVTRLVVSRMHVGSLLGRGGKIIEHMRLASKAHIRVLTRDHVLPRCVATSEEIVQVAGEMDAVKDAVEIISLRLRESQHRDRSHCRGRQYSPDRYVDADFISQRQTRRRSTRRLSTGSSIGRSNKYSSHSSGYAIDSGAAPITQNIDCFTSEELVFRILCPVDKLNIVIGESGGIIGLLQNEIGVDVKVGDHIAAIDEQIIIISSDEGPDDELFPAQEALLHIQTRIADLVPEKENIVTTRLLVQADEMRYLEGRDGLPVEMRKISGAEVQTLHGEELAECTTESDGIVEIVGEIKAAREALIEITARLRSYAFGEFMQEEASPLRVSAPVPTGLEATSGYDATPCQKTYIGSNSTTSSHHNSPEVANMHLPKGHLFDLNTCAVVEELDCVFVCISTPHCSLPSFDMFFIPPFFYICLSRFVL